VLPDLEFYVDALVHSGITPWFHFDTDWTKFLPYFQRFPRASCVAEFDGCTDMVKAKETLGDTMTLKGDVPANVLAFGTRDEVLGYCKRLIQEVGKGGGFILGSGCSIPANAREENIRALTDAVEEWGWY
jgi:uroporphyrinogen-III decarboxylase